MTEETLKILKARAGMLARKPSEQEQPSGDLLAVAVFLLAHERCALEFHFIREICPLKEPTLLPCTPPFVLGIINLRGQILSVIDFRRYAGLPVKGMTELNRVDIQESGDMEFGILADEILGMRTMPRREMQRQPFQTGILAHFIMGIASDGWIVLGGEKILADRKIVVEEEANV
jgi:purine-binding chemotaxis protein CheW